MMLHASFLKNHMKKHAEILRPKFELVLEQLDKELSGLEIGEWTKPLGGYFVSFQSMEGCAKEIVAAAAMIMRAITAIISFLKFFICVSPLFFINNYEKPRSSLVPRGFCI